MTLPNAKHPVEYLWTVLSEGLHGSMTDELCYENASKVHLVLSHAIKHINENNNDNTDLKNILS